MRYLPYQTLVVGLATLASLTVASGCSSPEPEAQGAHDSWEENADAIKKKVKPTGGNGAIDWLTPTWSINNMYGSLSVPSLGKVELEGRLQAAPGPYVLDLNMKEKKVTGNEYDEMAEMDGVNFRENHTTRLNVVAGAVSSLTPGGLRIRFARATTLGDVVVKFGTNSLEVSGDRYREPWAQRENGIGVLTLPGYSALLTSSTGAVSGSGQSELRYTSEQGKLVDVVLPVATVEVKLDEYDRSYPDAEPASLEVGEDRMTVRDGSDLRGPPAGKQVVPAGPNVQLFTRVGYLRSAPQVAQIGSRTVFVLHRLEVDDVEIRDARGAVTSVRGSYDVTQKTANGRASVVAGLPTHTGLDLPDGTYEVTSTANTRPGKVVHTETVSFP